MRASSRRAIAAISSLLQRDEALGGGASEEGADEAAVGWDSVGELLVGEGAGEEEAGGVSDGDAILAGRDS